MAAIKFLIKIVFLILKMIYFSPSNKTEKTQEKTLKEYKEQNEKNVALLREDMKRYNNAMERLAATEQAVSSLRQRVITLEELYNGAIDKMTSCPHYNK